MTLPAPEIIRRYFWQLTEGCDSGDCTQSECKSCRDFKHSFDSPSQAAAYAVKLALQHPSNPRICKNFWTYDELTSEETSAITAFDSLMASFVHRRETPDEVNPVIVIRNVLQLPHAFPYVLLAPGQKLHPHVQSLGFNDVFVCDIPQALRDMDKVIDIVGNLSASFETTVWDLIENDPPNTLHHVRSLVLICFFDIFLKSERAREILMGPLLSHIATLPKWASNFLTKSLSNYPQVIASLLSIVKTSFASKVRDDSKSIYDPEKYKSLTPYADMICRLYTANGESNAPLMNSNFVCAFLQDRLDKDFETSVITRNGKHRGYIAYPPIIALPFKAGIFHRLLKKMAVSGRTYAKVRRQTLVNDAMKILDMTPNELHKQLKIEFVGESAIDVGGPLREFIKVTAEALFSPDYSMWQRLDNEMLWFTDSTFEDMKLYEAMGKFVGLAVVQGVLIPVRFSHLMYKKLIGKKLTLKDLAALDEDVARSLESMIQMREGGGDVADCDLTFTVMVDTFGSPQELPMFEGGESVMVTNENLDEYIRYYTHWRMDTAVLPQYRSFVSGLSQMFPIHWLWMFNPDELDVILSGEAEYDWKALQAGASYSGCKKSDKTVKIFWKVFQEQLTEQQRKEILYFATSTSRVPMGGLGNLKFCIKLAGRPQDLPTSHTCFNQLVLPPCTSESAMKEKLLVVVANAQGFGCE